MISIVNINVIFLFFWLRNYLEDSDNSSIMGRWFQLDNVWGWSWHDSNNTMEHFLYEYFYHYFTLYEMRGRSNNTSYIIHWAGGRVQPKIIYKITGFQSLGKKEKLIENIELKSTISMLCFPIESLSCWMIGTLPKRGNFNRPI